MRISLLSTLVTFGTCALLFTAPAFAAPVVGQSAPAFSAKDINGAEVQLESLKGKVVVLEWFNYGCPFVRKHYRNGDMQALQKSLAEKGVVWVIVNSTETTHQDYKDEAATKKLLSELNVTAPHFILDTTGDIGKAYAAKTTPHMYVIDAEGVLRYQGAIDDDSDADADPKKSHNHLSQAVSELLAGKDISTKETKPYGCSIKYAK